MRCGCAVGMPLLELVDDFPLIRVLSFKVLQLPQEGHLPVHLVVSYPQSVQKKIVAIAGSFILKS
jgi:hypothetical protein